MVTTDERQTNQVREDMQDGNVRPEVVPDLPHMVPAAYPPPYAQDVPRVRHGPGGEKL